MIDRSRVVAEVHEMVGARFFGSGPWLAEREVADALRKMSGVSKSQIQKKLLGRRFSARKRDWDLIMVFAGIFNEFEEPTILENTV